MPPRSAAPPADRGVLVLEEKLRILTEGHRATHRNPALDVLTGRVADDRVHVLMASRASTMGSTSAPSAMVLPVAAIRMAAVARAQGPRPAPSPWLRASTDAQPRLQLILIKPPPSRWARVPLIGFVLSWLRVEFRPYTWRARSPRAHLAS